ncbi:TPA: hypothetical protein ACRFJD_003698, partial [Elizabethkingia anophelis]
IKIIPFYENLKKEEQINLIQYFFQLTNINIRVNDLLGKLSITILKALIDGENQDIIINSIGLSENSISFLTEHLKKILNNFKDKNIFIVKNNQNTIDFDFSKL